MADTKISGDGLLLKTKPADTQVPSKSLRHIITDEQLEALKTHKTGIEIYLLFAAIGVCIGSATGSLSALGRFLSAGTLTLEGFIQNMCFFSSLLAVAILLVIYLPRRNDFSVLVNSVRARE